MFAVSHLAIYYGAANIEMLFYKVVLTLSFHFARKIRVGSLRVARFQWNARNMFVFIFALIVICGTNAIGAKSASTPTIQRIHIYAVMLFIVASSIGFLLFMQGLWLLLLLFLSWHFSWW